jgi:hypothetical protein
MLQEGDRENQMDYVRGTSDREGLTRRTESTIEFISKLVAFPTSFEANFPNSMFEAGSFHLEKVVSLPPPAQKIQRS